MASTYTYSIRRLISYTCHDSDQDVFLDGERTGVYSNTEYLFARHNVCPRSPNRERDKLGNDLAEPKTLSLPNSKVKSSRSTYGSDSDGGEPEKEELVHTGDDDGTDDADDPSP